MKKYILLLLVSVFLVGCATTKPTPPTSPITPPTSQSELKDLHHWVIHGKLGVQHQNKGTNAYLEWQQNNEQYLVKLSGPLGQGTIEIQGGPNGATLTDSQGKKIEVKSIEDFFKKRFGWELPLSCLYYWIKGLPAPEAILQSSRYEDGTLKTLSQHGWQIQYQDYMTTTKGKLPQRLTLQYPGTQLKVIIKRWDF